MKWLSEEVKNDDEIGHLSVLVNISLIKVLFIVVEYEIARYLRYLSLEGKDLY